MKKTLTAKQKLSAQPNKETIKSFEDVRNKKNLTISKDFDDFWRKINSQQQVSETSK